METLIIQQQHPPSVVTGAAVGSFLSHVSHVPQLVALTSDCLWVYVSADDEGLQLLETVPLFELFDAVFTIDAATAGQPDRLLLVSGQLGRVVLVALKQGPTGHLVFEELSSVNIHAPQQGCSKRMDGVCCSRLWSGQGCGLLAVALYTDHVHIVRMASDPAAEGGSGAQLQCAAFNLRHCATICKPSESRGQQRPPHMAHVLAMELMPCGDALGQLQGSMLLAVLFRVAGAGYTATDVECLELLNALPTPGAHQCSAAATTTTTTPGTTATSSTTSGPARPLPTTMELCEGPWSCRYLHPSACLLHALPATPTLPAGLLVISSTSVLLISGPGSWQACLDPPAVEATGTGAQAGAAAGAGARQQQLGQGGVGVARHEVLQLGLAGVPSCIEVMPSPDGGQLVLVGDSMAGLHLLHVGGPSGSHAITVSVRGPVSPPSLLRLLPASAIAHPTQPSYLFLASHEANTQLLTVPNQLTRRPTSDPQPPTANGNSNGSWSVTFTLADAALIKSLAPVRSALFVPDSQGAGDQTLVVGAGSAPWGRLARAKLALALSPYFPSGTTLPESVQLFALGGPAPALTTHLAFSFSVSGRTEVLSLEGDTFRQVTLPGLDTEAGSLLLTTLGPSGLVAQVCPSGVRLLAPLPACELLHAWAPPPTAAAAAGGASGGGGAQPGGGSGAPAVSLAASAGDVVVVATVDRIFTLQVDTSASPPLQLLSSVAVSHQTSALGVELNLLLPGGNGGGGRGGAAVIWGEWVSNRLVVAAATDLAQPLLVVDLGGYTARSALAMPLPGGRWALAAGTNSGAALLWELQGQQQQHSQQGAGASGTSNLGPTLGWAEERRESVPLAGPWRTGPQCVVQVSNVAVQLSFVQGAAAEPGTAGAAPWPYLYAHSGQDAVIRLAPTCGPTPPTAPSSSDRPTLPPQPPVGVPLPALLQAARVHGSSWLQAACPLHTPSMPNSWAWVTAGNQLMFGRLNQQLQLRWTTALIGETPHCVAYHHTSRCYVLLTEDGQGGQTLRLVHGETLQPLLAMRLSPGHRYTSLKVCSLPCTSGTTPHTLAQDTHHHHHLRHTTGSSPSHTHHPPSEPHTKEFVVMASYLMHDGATLNAASTPLARSTSTPSAPSGVPTTTTSTTTTTTTATALPQHAQGLLSFFEVTVQRTSTVSSAVSSSPSEVQYSLLLHGVTPVSGVPTSLNSVTPSHAPPEPTPKPDPVHRSDPHYDRKTADAARQAALAAAAAAAAQATAERLPLQPHLVVGCSEHVHAYRVCVDDGRCAGPEAAARLMAAAAAAPERVAGQGAPARLFTREATPDAAGAGALGAHDMIPPELIDDEDEDEEMEEEIMDEYRRIRAEQWGEEAGGSGGGGGEGGAAHAAALERMAELLRRNWSQHVMLDLVARGCTFAGSAVSHLSSHGSLVLASDLLASVSLFSLQQRPGRPGAPPVVSLVPLGADHMPVYAQSALMVSDDHMVVSEHPHGLALLARDRQYENQLAAQRDPLASSRPRPSPPGAPPEPSSVGDSAWLEVRAACRVRHTLNHLLPGRMGLHLDTTGGQDTATLHGGGSSSSSSSSRTAGVAGSSCQGPGVMSTGGEGTCGVQGGGGRGLCVTGVGADGSVCQVTVLGGTQDARRDEEVQLGRRLLAAQGQVEARQSELGLGLRCAAHTGRWGLAVKDETSLTAQPGVGREDMVRQLPGNCLDGQLVVEGLARAGAGGQQGALGVEEGHLIQELMQLLL